MVGALLKAVPAILDVLVVVMLFLVIFGILGVQVCIYFKDRDRGRERERDRKAKKEREDDDFN